MHNYEELGKDHKMVFCSFFLVNFLIDKEGTIVAKNIYGKSLEAKLDELTK